MTTLASWRSWVADVGDIPTAFLMKWIEVESYGNPCAVGIAGVEAGIGQTYHPDDDRHGATFAQLRTNCNGAKETRSLTDDERALQVRVLLSLVRSCRSRAQAKLDATNTQWSTSTSDYWALVKLVHGLPGIVNVLLPACAKKHGAPSSFAEFRAYCVGLSVDEVESFVANGNAWVKRFKSEFPRIFNNAEKTAATSGGFVAVSSAPSALYAIPVLGLLAKLWARVLGKGGGAM